MQAEIAEASLVAEWAVVEEICNEMVLLQAQVETFRETMAKTNAIAYQSQDHLTVANARITHFLNKMHQVKHTRESWKMTANTYKA